MGLANDVVLQRDVLALRHHAPDRAVETPHVQHVVYRLRRPQTPTVVVHADVVNHRRLDELVFRVGQHGQHRLV